MTHIIGTIASSMKSTTYYINTLTQASVNSEVHTLSPDSNNNYYYTGYIATSGYPAIIGKFDSNGNLLWQREFNATGGTYIYGGDADSSGNVYFASYSTPSGNNLPLLGKYNTSGTLQWQRIFNVGGSQRKIKLDSSANIYGSFQTGAGGIFYKYNSSGTLQWQRKLTNGATGDALYAGQPAVDSSGNATWPIWDNGATIPMCLVKYNTSGTLQWQRKVTKGTTPVYAGSAVCDSSGNIYASCRSDTGGVNEGYLMKYDSSGVLQWQRKITNGSINVNVTTVAVDSTGNVYLQGTTGSTSTLYIIKYNSSGTLQWQRTILAGPSTVSSQDNFQLDSKDNILIATYMGLTPSKAFTMKIPSDGSKTGTYTIGGQNVVYSASSLTDAAGSLTDAAGGLTDAAGSTAETSGSGTDTAGSLTSATVTI